MGPNEPGRPGEGVRRGLKRTAARAGVVASVAIRVIRATRAVVWAVLQTALALVIVFEEWGWQPLAALLARLARLKPVAWAEARVAVLPPYAALLAFALPSVLILPLKLVSLWLIAKGQVIVAGLLFIGAKVVGTALLARIFQLARPALMQLAWFASAYNTLIPWKEAVLAGVRASWAWRWGRLVKRQIKQAATRQWLQWKPLLAPLADRLRRLLRRQG